jgi:hypothetical protein
VVRGGIACHHRLPAHTATEGAAGQSPSGDTIALPEKGRTADF